MQLNPKYYNGITTLNCVRMIYPCYMSIARRWSFPADPSAYDPFVKKFTAAA
jgi:hypothetical protein